MGDDLIEGSGDADGIEGLDGDDTLYGYGGDDTLDGGNGNDVLIGGAGHDSYFVESGTVPDVPFHDVVDNYDTDAGAIDALYFIDAYLQTDVNLQRLGDDLVVTWGSLNTLTVLNQFAGQDYAIDYFVAKANPSSDHYDAFSFEDVLSQKFINLTAGDDSFTFSGLRERVKAGSGNDLLFMGAGNDEVQGEDGDDTIDGGVGNDTITGGAGNDTVILRLGAGVDTINPTTEGTGFTNRIIFEDVASTGLTHVQRISQNLILSYGDGDQVTVAGAFNNATPVEYHFSDNQVWDLITLLEHYPVHLTDNADNTSFTASYPVSVYAGLGDDNVAGNIGDDTIHGEDGNDLLNGKAGNDSLDGGAGDDSLVGDIGDDALLGGGGNDTLMGEDGHDLMVGNDGNDSFSGGLRDDTLDGGQGNDRLIGNAGSNRFIFRVGDGVDQVSSQDSNLAAVKTIQFLDVNSNELNYVRRVGIDLLLGYGSGDQITVLSHFSSANNEITHFAFADGTLGYSELITLYPIELTSGADTAVFSSRNENIHALAGNDTIDGGAGHDTLYGEDGNDSLTGGADNDYLDGGADNDTLLGGTGADTLTGGAGNDSLIGGTGGDTYLFQTGDGVDRVSAADSTAGAIKTLQFLDQGVNGVTLKRVGSDLVIAYGAADQVTVAGHFSAAANELQVYAFVDHVLGVDEFLAYKGIHLTGNADNMTFGARAELVFGDLGADTIIGGAGNDTLWGEDGNDRLQGGTDHDQLYGGTGADNLLGEAGDDSLDGGDGNDILTGDVGNDYLFGGADNDNLTGGGGADTLEGGTGNDTLAGSGGNDVFRFSVGDGVDRMSATDSTAGVVKAIEFLNMTHDQLGGLSRVGSDLLIAYGSGDQVTITGFFSAASNEIQLAHFADYSLTMDELLTAYTINLTANGDNMTFTAHNEAIQAGGGNDTINAGAGNDIVYGDLGADNLSGGLGMDTLYGGDGNDTLSGGDGDDLLEGGAGNDSYVLGNGSDTVVLPAGSGTDTVNAAEAAGGFDVVVFEDVDPSGIVSASQSGNNLIIDYAGGARVTITGQFLAANAVDLFQFAGGYNYTAADLLALY